MRRALERLPVLSERRSRFTLAGQDITPAFERIGPVRAQSVCLSVLGDCPRRICTGSLKINLSQAFAGQKVGVKQVADRVWLVSFMQYDLGYFDDETCRIESATNPFAAKLSPMSPV